MATGHEREGEGRKRRGGEGGFESEEEAARGVVGRVGAGMWQLLTLKHEGESWESCSGFVETHS